MQRYIRPVYGAKWQCAMCQVCSQRVPGPSVQTQLPQDIPGTAAEERLGRVHACSHAGAIQTPPHSQFRWSAWGDDTFFATHTPTVGRQATTCRMQAETVVGWFHNGRRAPFDQEDGINPPRQVLAHIQWCWCHLSSGSSPALVCQQLQHAVAYSQNVVFATAIAAV